ncbi:substrate-binding domain-containing protein [Streptomyces sp. NPDC001617]
MHPASDLMASGALEAPRARGRRVSEDVADLVESADPPLTTVHQDVEGMGRLMAGLQFERTSEPPSVVVPTRLTVRESA